MNDSGYRLLFEAHPQPMFVFELSTFRFLDVNEAAVRHYGYSREEFLAMTILDIRPQEDRARFQQHFQKELAGTQMRALGSMRGWRHQRKDGTLMDVEVGWSRVPFKDRDAWLVVIKDVTEQRRAEDELQKSAEQFRALFRHVPMPTYCWRAKGDDFELINYNDAAEEVSRGAIRNWLGVLASKMYPDLPEIPADFARCLREKKKIPVEMDYLMRSTGEVKKLSVVYTFVPPDMVMAHTEDISRRVEALEAARRSEERFFKAFHANPAAIIISSLDSGEIIDVNESFCRVYGYEREEVLGKISLELGIWPTGEERRRLVAQLKTEGRLRNVEATIRTRGGEDRLVSLSTEFLELEHRSCILSILQDITERKRMEEKLRYNERLKQQVLDSVPGGVVYVDKGGAVREANGEAQALLGLTYDQLTSTYISDFSTKTIWEDGTPCNVEEYPVAKCLKTQQPQPKTTIGVVKPDGTVSWGVYAATPVFAQDTNAFSGVVVTFLDVTPRKMAEEALRESELRFRQLAENIHEVFWMRDPERQQMLYVSPAYEAIWGRSTESLYRDPSSYLAGIHPSDQARAIQAEEQQRGGLDTAVEYRVVRPDGSERWVRDRGFPILGPGGAVERVAGVAEDITEQQAAERALQDYAERLRNLSSRLLEAQEAERRHIARELHDEIGQTLTATKLSLQSAQRSGDPGASESKILDGVRLVERLLEQVRNLSLDLCPPQLDFLGLVPALRSYVEEQAARAGLQSQFFADDNMGRLPSVIEVACFRVAQEAVTNVIRHAKARSVSVRLLQDVEELHLYVRDDGIGFDFAEARQRAGRGESLGILGMEERVALLGGEMTCQSRRGGGTEVHACFPLEGGGCSSEVSE